MESELEMHRPEGTYPPTQAEPVPAVTAVTKIEAYDSAIYPGEMCYEARSLTGIEREAKLYARLARKLAAAGVVLWCPVQDGQAEYFTLDPEVGERLFPAPDEEDAEAVYAALRNHASAVALAVGIWIGTPFVLAIALWIVTWGIGRLH